jgi:(1->4)-alpha-D-glucan 1-alpha-D-glucosylmutase
MTDDVCMPPPESTFDADGLRAELARAASVPTSTYRLQLHKGFTFRDAAATVPYLATLGIGAVYCSPYLKSRPGSTHGYDICDHNQLNPEIGTEEDYAAFVEALHRYGLTQVLDIVPNHMAADPVANPWWRDVLENGRASAHAACFDIDWEPLKTEIRGKVLLPVLGDHYGVVLEQGQLELVYDNGSLVIRFHEANLPIDARTVPRVLREPGEALNFADANDADTREFLSIMTALERLPPTSTTNPEKIAERRREKEVARDRLGRLTEQSENVRRHVHSCTARLKGTPGEPASFDRLHELLEAQPYRLAYWKTASHEINYRRFFDINGLAGVRVEDPAVFEATHRLIVQLIVRGAVNGLRIDHIDGLFDPAAYVDRLQEEVVIAYAEKLRGKPPDDRAAFREAVRAWRTKERQAQPGGAVEKPVFVVAEKILTVPERLPTTWALHGTSGYDFLNDLDRVFVSDAGLKVLTKTYERFAHAPARLGPMIYECKRLIVGTAMAGELNVLAHALNRISERSRRSRDFTLNALRVALRDIVACFPVYRTYITPDGVSEADRRVIELAIRRARRMNPASEPTIFEFIREVLLPFGMEGLSEDDLRIRLDFTMKFQQYTGPVHAKGVEDTAFYRFIRLLSLNEVGGEPQHGGLSPGGFHEANRRRHKDWPRGMLSTATHDTKRGADARARLNVLSEIPEEWSLAVSRWSRINARHRKDFEGEPAPSRNDEYLFFQALLGAWPAEPPGTIYENAPADFVERMVQYMIKAAKEAKVYTSWISPDAAYDQAIGDYVRGVLTGVTAKKFLASFLPFQQRIARLGMVNSLAQVVLKIASPGVPDFYQGTERWDLSLVDPDNRQPVDFTQSARLLAEATSICTNELLRSWTDGRVKMAIISRGLALRNLRPSLFQEGDYVPLEVIGEKANHIVAFARRFDGAALVAVAPRLVAGLSAEENPLPCGPGAWGETRLVLVDGIAGRILHNVLTGESCTPGHDHPIAELLRDFPIGLFNVP